MVHTGSAYDLRSIVAFLVAQAQVTADWPSSRWLGGNCGAQMTLVEAYVMDFTHLSTVYRPANRPHPGTPGPQHQDAGETDDSEYQGQQGVAPAVSKPVVHTRCEYRKHKSEDVGRHSA